MKKLLPRILLFSFLLTQTIFTKVPKIINFTKEEIDFLNSSKEDVAYVSNDVKKTVNHLCKKGVFQNSCNSLLQFCQACQNDWKVVPMQVAQDALKEAKSLLKKNKDKLPQQKFQKFNSTLKDYKSQLSTKEAQFFFESNSKDQVQGTAAFFNDLVVKDTLTCENLLRVNQADGSLAFRAGQDNKFGERVRSRIPVKINFTDPNGPNALVVIGTTATDDLLVRADARIRGTLNVNTDIQLLGSSVITNAANVGYGTGKIFQDKSGNTLNFKSLAAGTNVTLDTSNPDQITISAAGTGLGDVTGPSSSTDNAIAKFNGTTGKIIQNSGVIIDSSNNISGAHDVTASGTIQGTTLSDGAGSTINGGTVAATVLSDNAGTFISAGQVAAITLTDRVASINSGNITGANNIGTINITATGTVQGSFITDGAGSTISGGTVTANTITDGQGASMSSGNIIAQNVIASNNITASNTVQGVTLTDGTASLTGGALTGATSITASGTIQGGTLTDGTATMTGGTVTAQNVVVNSNINLTTDPSTSSSGLIQKNGTPFLHNIGNTNNLFAGENAGTSTTGSFNTGLGSTSLNTLSGGTNNTAVGASAMSNCNAAVADTTAVGSGACVNGGNQNTIVGSGAQNAANTGSNTAVGYLALQSNTASNNIALGALAGSTVGIAGSNIYVANIGTLGDSHQIRIGTQGTGAGQQNACAIAGIRGSSVSGGNLVEVDSSGNLGDGGSTANLVTSTSTPTANQVATFTGTGKAIQNTPVTISSITGDISTAGNLNLSTDPSTSSAGNVLKNGVLFLHNIGGTTNLFAGENAGSSNTGTQNTGVGFQAVQSNTGTNNVGIGYNALAQNTGGTDNVAIGASAQFASSATGSRNVAIGSGALSSTGNDNIAIGYQAGGNLSNAGESNNILIGNLGNTNESAAIRIGTSQIKAFMAGIREVAVAGGHTVQVDANGQLGDATASSKRYKRDINDINDFTDNLYKLRPVSFKYNPELDKSGQTQYGLIAEEVEQQIPELVIYKDGQPEAVKYQVLPILLLNELKKLRTKLDAQEEEIKKLKSAIAA